MVMPLTGRLENFSYKILRIQKAIRHLSKHGNSEKPKTILFIIGCQRSGTSLMTRIFENDFKTKIYNERSVLSSDDKINGKRLNSLDKVKKIIDNDRVEFVVVKPLVESQNANQLLEFFPNSKALWMFRNYRDVVSSNLKLFGIQRGIRNLKPIVLRESNNWRSEHVSEYTRDIINQYFSEDMNPYDAAALFWFARNRIFFEKNLDSSSAVGMCRYEDLVVQPKITMKNNYKFLGVEFPSEKILDDIKRSSIGKGDGVDISEEIDSLCRELLVRLELAYEEKMGLITN